MLRTPHHFTIPIRTVSEANRHEHWRARQKRAKLQRAAAALATIGYFSPYRPPDPEQAPLTVTITRVSPRALDDDNLRGALKHVRDGLADALFRTHDSGNAKRRWANDNRPCLTWQYAQAKGRTHCVKITLEATP